MRKPLTLPQEREEAEKKCSANRNYAHNWVTKLIRKNGMENNSQRDPSDVENALCNAFGKLDMLLKEQFPERSQSKKIKQDVQYYMFNMLGSLIEAGPAEFKDNYREFLEYSNEPLRTLGSTSARTFASGLNINLSLHCRESEEQISTDGFKHRHRRRPSPEYGILSEIKAIMPVILKRSRTQAVESSSSTTFLVECPGNGGITSNKISASACVRLADLLDKKYGIQASIPAISITHDPRVKGAVLTLMHEEDREKAQRIFQELLECGPYMGHESSAVKAEGITR